GRRDGVPRPARRGRADRRDPGLVPHLPRARRGGRPALHRPHPAGGGRWPVRRPAARGAAGPARPAGPPGIVRRLDVVPPAPRGADPRGGRAPARGVGEDGRPLGGRGDRAPDAGPAPDPGAVRRAAVPLTGPPAPQPRYRVRTAVSAVRLDVPPITVLTCCHGGSPLALSAGPGETPNRPPHRPRRARR